MGWAVNDIDWRAIDYYLARSEHVEVVQHKINSTTMVPMTQFVKSVRSWGLGILAGCISISRKLQLASVEIANLATNW